MQDKFFKEVAAIMSKHGLVRQIDKLGKAYYLEFQTKVLSIDGEDKRYLIKGLSQDKRAVYDAMVEIHKEFNVDLSFLEKADFDNLEEYLFHMKEYEIDGKFGSYRRV